MKSRRLLLALFFASGTAGLMYELVWVRLLVLVFGNTTHSVVAVVSAFLGGLALGSVLFGRLADRRNPGQLIALYARLELAVGITALAATFLIPGLGFLYGLLGTGESVAGWVLLVKFLGTAALILVPTGLMGATLPVLVAFLRSQESGTRLDRTVGWLYAVNTFGAVFGTALAGFVLLELTGLRATALVAAALNVAVALLARQVPVGVHPPPLVDRSGGNGHLSPVVIIPALAFSGFFAIAYQVLWTRALTPTTGTFVYAFALILLLYLLGIALGSILYALVLERSRFRELAFSLSQAGIALGAMGSVWMMSIHADLPRAVLVLGVILPATVCMGVSFPAGIALLRGERRAGRTVGTAYAANTVGSILGGFAAGFVLIPLIGSTQGILVASVGSFALAVALARPRPALPRAFAALYVVALLGLAGFDAWVYAAKRDGLYEASTERRILAARAAGFPYRFAEDEVASVFAYRDPVTGARDLVVDGVPITNIGPETRFMAHLPLALHPNPERVAVIAFGMGSTFRSALLHEDARVDAVELSRAVAGMFPILFADADAVTADPQGRIVINDGRNHVRLTARRYDVVTIDPPPPFNAAGTTVLYARDFYRDISRVLRPGGIVSQWLYFGSRTDDTAMAVRAFTDEFPYVLVFRSPGSVAGIYLIGSHERIAVDDGRLRDVFRSDVVKADFAEVGTVMSPRDVTDLLIADGSDLRAFADGYPPVTDDRPRTEYFLLRHAFTESPPMSMKELIERIGR